MLTNLCLGTTIFTFAVRTKAFGLVWFLVACFIVACVNYWSIMRCVYASSKCQEDDYSEITQKLLRKKMRIIIKYFYYNLFIWIYDVLFSFNV